MNTFSQEQLNLISYVIQNEVDKGGVPQVAGLRIAGRLADYMQDNDPTFDREAFIKACK